MLIMISTNFAILNKNFFHEDSQNIQKTLRLVVFISISFFSMASGASAAKFNEFIGPIGNRWESQKISNNAVRSIAIAADGHSIAWIVGQTIFVYNDKLYIYEVPDKSVFLTSVTISLDGKTVFAGAGTGTVYAWHRTGASDENSAEPHRSDQTKFLCLIAFANSNRENWQVMQSFAKLIRINFSNTISDTETMLCPSVSSDFRNYIMTGSFNEKYIKETVDGTLQLWQADGTRVSAIHGVDIEKGEIVAAAISTDRALVVSSDIGYNVHVWKKSSSPFLWLGALLNNRSNWLRDMRGHQGTITSLSISTDNKLCASGSADSTVRIWDLSTGLSRQTISDFTAPVISVAFTANRKCIAVGDNEGSLSMWSAENYNNLGSINSKKDNKSTVMFDGNMRHCLGN